MTLKIAIIGDRFMLSSTFEKAIREACPLPIEARTLDDATRRKIVAELKKAKEAEADGIEVLKKLVRALEKDPMEKPEAGQGE